MNGSIAEYIENNAVTCNCCQHVMIDVTAAQDGTRPHCTAGDPEGDGVACAHGMLQDRERERDELMLCLT